MIIRKKALQAVLVATLKEDRTHRCDKIQVTPAGQIVATDGHLLLMASETTRFPDEDFPAKDIPEYHGDPTEPITIDRPLVERLIKGTGKAKPIPILAAVQLGTNGEGSYVAATDLQSPTVIRLKPQSEQPGSFPTWERVVPAADKPSIQITIGSDLLVALAKAATAVALSARASTGGKVTFFIPTEPQYQGLDKAKALAAGCAVQRGQYNGEQLLDPNTGRQACERDYPDGKIQSAIRVEIDGAEVQLVGVVAPIRRAK